MVSVPAKQKNNNPTGRKEKAMTEYQFYQVEKKDKVAWVYLNRPEKKECHEPSGLAGAGFDI